MMEEVRKRLKEAKKVVVLTGAGISQESGIPTFRGRDGLWKNYKPEELATPEAFRRNPQLVWEWYNWRREIIRKAEPNPAHLALVELEKRYPFFYLITQNVDGLHQRAGNKNVLELHGNIWRNFCFECGKEYRGEITPEVPRCECGGYIRPGVVWFGEPLPADVLRKAWEVSAQVEVFLVIGTSGVVQPAASLPLVAKEHGAWVVEINPQETALTPWVDASLRGTACQLLPEIVKGG